MDPFSRIGYIFAEIATWGLRISDKIYEAWLVPDFLGDWFKNSAVWFFDVYLRFLDAAAVYQRITVSLGEFTRAADVLAIMSQFTSRVNEIWSWFSSWSSSTGSVISLWWSGVVDQVQSWIQVAKQEVITLLDNLAGDLAGLRSSWEDFRTMTLPNLVDRTWWSAFWGAGISTIDGWWSPRRREIRDELEAEVKPVRDKVNQHSTWFDVIRDFIEDPGDFLLKEIEKALERYW